MSGYFKIGVLLSTCLGALACQSYTSGLQKSTTMADETAAISAIHTVATAERMYSISNSGSYATFQQLVKGGSLDARFDTEAPKIKGYVLSMTITPRAAGTEEDSFTINADPEATGPQAGGRHFFTDSSGMIHVNPSQPATASDPPLGQ
jgi:Tfp pilus assembly protein PilE